VNQIGRKDGWLSAKIGSELVMMSAQSGFYIGCNEVGARIWELLEAPMTVDSLCAKLMSEYEVTLEQAHTEVGEFLEELAKHEAITFDPAPNH